MDIKLVKNKLHPLKFSKQKKKEKKGLKFNVNIIN